MSLQSRFGIKTPEALSRLEISTEDLISILTMVAVSVALIAGLAAVSNAACPFELMKRSGVLYGDDIAKFDAVKRNPKAAEALFEAYKREASPDPTPADPIGPIVSGILDLPYGGGLRESSLK